MPDRCASSRGRCAARKRLQLHLELANSILEGLDQGLELLGGVARNDMLRTVPVESGNPDQDAALNEPSVVGGLQLLKDRVVLVDDLDAPQELEACPAGVIHQYQRDARITFEIAQ